ncbi:MAG: hypothetical protein II748_01855, partial [Clostridia bacterium]|nr:hypothetical protein [Clostridia bacterium]
RAIFYGAGCLHCSYNAPYEKIGNAEPVSIADEVPFEIPESWEWVRFKNLVSYNMGKTPPRKEYEYAVIFSGESVGRRFQLVYVRIYRMADRSLYPGHFTPRLPDGKRKGFNVYAQTREECEKKLAEMIVEVKAKIAAEKA